MRQIHNKLLKISPLYDKWHQRPEHKFFHWLVFVSLSGILAVLLVLNIYTVYVFEPGQAYGLNIKALNSPQSEVSKGGVVGEAEGYILVKFKRTLSAKEQEKIFSRNNLKEKSEIKAIGVKLVSISADDTLQEAVDKFKAKEKNNLEFAEVDAIVAPSLTPNDLWYPNEGNLPKISAPAAWDTTTGISSVIMAIVDTGVDGTQPDLTSKLVPGWNIYDNNSNTADVYGHGTIVAGVAGAISNNGVGVASVCWYCSIMPVRVSATDGSATYSNIASGITWAADHGARVANVSYIVSDSSTVTSAAQYMWNHNSVVTSSSGNYSTFDPASDNPYILTVSATDASDLLYSWSNTGNNIDLAAPGWAYTTYVNGVYGLAAGTSISSPVVAGTAGLVYSANPSLTAIQVQNILKQSADDLGASGWDSAFGYGRVNAAKAVSLACAYPGATCGGTPPPADTQAPSAPTNLSASAPDGTKVNLVWTASTDNVGVAGYQIFKGGNQITTVSSTNYTDTNVTSGASYSYTVRAYDNTGNISADSNTATITIPTISAKVSILNYSVTKKTSTTATITWTTNIPSTSFVSYGTSIANLNLSATDGALGTSHLVTLTNLNKSAKYYYKITTASGDGLSTASSPITNFRTMSK